MTLMANVPDGPILHAPDNLQDFTIDAQAVDKPEDANFDTYRESYRNTPLDVVGKPGDHEEGTQYTNGVWWSCKQALMQGNTMSCDISGCFVSMRGVGAVAVKLPDAEKRENHFGREVFDSIY